MISYTHQRNTNSIHSLPTPAGIQDSVGTPAGTLDLVGTQGGTLDSAGTPQADVEEINLAHPTPAGTQDSVVTPQADVEETNLAPTPAGTLASAETLALPAADTEVKEGTLAMAEPLQEVLQVAMEDRRAAPTTMTTPHLVTRRMTPLLAS